MNALEGVSTRTTRAAVIHAAPQFLNMQATLTKNLQEIIGHKKLHDLAGHYNRADVFRLSIDRSRHEILIPERADPTATISAMRISASTMRKGGPLDEEERS